MNARGTRSIGVLQMGQSLGMSATAYAQLEQKRVCSQETRTTPERGVIRQTSHISRLAVDMKFPIHIHIHRRLTCVHAAPIFCKNAAVQERLS